MKSEIWESFFTNFRCRRLIHCKIFDFPYFYKTCSRRQKVWETIIPISVCSSYRGIPLYPGGSVAVWWSGSDWDCCQRSSEGHAILSALLERPTYLISFFTTPSMSRSSKSSFTSLSSYLWRNTGVFQNWKPIRDTLTDIQSTFRSSTLSLSNRMYLCNAL